MSDRSPLRSPFVEAMGAELLEWAEGRVRWGITLGPQHTNPGGIMHGGVVAALLDEAVAGAITSLRGQEAVPSDPHLLLEMNVSFLSAARPGERLEVEGWVLRMGRQVAFAEAEARRLPGGQLVAKGRFTFLLPARRD
ncbi:MAG: PaaI family thioesterase [Dehalococcoidia bacterium]|mgnify:CR=1 FL=1|nr:PaaI family thioesterase [Dehalococcoidia bacterium]MDW8008677.1 PaaI family thioesterase [Chloroflexota bacterium]